MFERPAPLAVNTLLQGRYELAEVLGQGAFGITYRAYDTHRKDLVVVRELAPADAVRGESGILRLSRAGEAAAQRLRQVFALEARQLSRLSGPGLLPIRTHFVELGTAFLVREHLPDAVRLADRVLREGRLSPDEVEALLAQLSETLDHLHRNEVVHLDLRPSNVLMSASGRAFLVDFGVARKWRRDLFRTEDRVEGMPPELRLRGSRIGPATDIYQLGATLHAAATGAPLPDPDQVVRGERPGLPSWLNEAINRALHPDMGERPTRAGQLLQGKLESPKPDAKEALDAFVKKAITLKSLRFDRRECPSCHGVLEEPKPLRSKVCPVCHEGVVRFRKVVERLCPHCRMGILREVPNLEPLAICPSCAEGLLVKRKRSMLSKEYVYACNECEAEFQWHDPDLLCVSGEARIGTKMTCEEWRRACGRSAQVWICPGCSAQFDLVPDGRWRQAVPAKTGRYEALDPSEWARVAAGLPPEAGNAECDACGADYFVEGEELALLASRFDPHGFAASSNGRLLNFTEVQWVGVGKESPRPGLVCHDCGTEFDFDGDLLRLIRTPNSGMLEFGSRPLGLENWHRAAQDLPLVGKEATFLEGLNVALRNAFHEGAVPFSDREPELLWKGPATRIDQDEKLESSSLDGQLAITKEEVRFGGILKKSAFPLASIRRIETEGKRLRLDLEADESAVYEVQGLEWTVELASGRTTISLSSQDLRFRLMAELQLA